MYFIFLAYSFICEPISQEYDAAKRHSRKIVINDSFIKEGIFSLSTVLHYLDSGSLKHVYFYTDSSFII